MSHSVSLYAWNKRISWYFSLELSIIAIYGGISLIKLPIYPCVTFPFGLDIGSTIKDWSRLIIPIILSPKLAFKMLNNWSENISYKLVALVAFNYLSSALLKIGFSSVFDNTLIVFLLGLITSFSKWYQQKLFAPFLLKSEAIPINSGLILIHLIY